MAYYKLNAYDADVFLNSFNGLSRTSTEINDDIRYADEEKNVETPNGVLQPKAEDEILRGDFNDARIETLARFHRRWYKGADKDWLVACVSGHLYYRQVGHDVEWEEVDLPSGVDAYQSSVWSWVTYEETPQNSTVTIDVLLLSNKKDGMIMISPPDRPKNWEDTVEKTWGKVKDNSYGTADPSDIQTWKMTKSASWTIQTVDTQGYKFGVICRYAERIWGGDVDGQPDLLVYSRPYNPKDWTGPGQDEEPEDCAGEIRQPSWDGASFTALRIFGDQLLAFKNNRVWRVMGVHPGEYSMKEQYGGGAPYPATVVVDTERVYMAETEGLSVYDGMSVAPYMRSSVEKIWRRINRSAMDQMCAAMFQKRLYFAFPVDGSTVNNALLVYNQMEGTILFYDNIYIEALLATDDCLFATSSSVPGKLLCMNYDSWVLGKASGKATRWVTPWMDFSRKDIVKGGFEVYFTPEVQEEPVTLTFSVQTEKKLKTKSYTIQPLTDEQKEAEKKHKGKRLHFGGSGRRFRLIIESAEGVTAPWRLVGGIMMIVETDPD